MSQTLSLIGIQMNQLIDHFNGYLMIELSTHTVHYVFSLGYYIDLLLLHAALFPERRNLVAVAFFELKA